ncbi:MAG: helix-turn-helix domain-containing protein [Flavobacteriales bacterium]|nr:helix-turn-helix domain-containing protein [Flavobacteriales bacterium]
MNNPFEEINHRLEALASEVRALKRANKEEPTDEIGGLDLAVKVTGLAARTIYKLTHRRGIPHRRVGGRLYFRRSELEGWLDGGRRPMASEAVHTIREGKK